MCSFQKTVVLQFLAEEEEEGFEKLRRYMEETFLTSLLINSNEKSSASLHHKSPTNGIHKKSFIIEEKKSFKKLDFFKISKKDSLSPHFVTVHYLFDKLCVLDAY